MGFVFFKPFLCPPQDPSLLPLGERGPPDLSPDPLPSQLSFPSPATFFLLLEVLSWNFGDVSGAAGCPGGPGRGLSRLGWSGWVGGARWVRGRSG